MRLAGSTLWGMNGYLASARHAADCAGRSARHANSPSRDTDRAAYWMASAGYWMRVAYEDYDRAHLMIARARRAS